MFKVQLAALSVLFVVSACKGDAAPAASGEEKKPANVAAPTDQPGQAEEFDIKFYLQPDGTGNKTENKRLELDNGMIEISEANADGVTNDTERKATPEEIAYIQEFARARVKAAKLSNQGFPRVEMDVQIGEAEAGERYPVGKVPADLLEFQKRFFKSQPFK